MEIELTFRDLQEVDLNHLGWSGGAAHLRALRAALELSWRGEVDLLVGELATGALVACGAVDHRKPTPTLWMLSVHEAWQGLGVGTALIGALEQRLIESGISRAAISVEHDNPRAAALYRRLGYREVGDEVESWPLDSGAAYVTVSALLEKDLAADA